MSGPIIAYRNPLEMWFWEGGWVYVVVPIVAAFVLLWAWLAWKERKAKRQRKQRWLEMSETQRAAWRSILACQPSHRRNNIEAEEREK